MAFSNKKTGNSPGVTKPPDSLDKRIRAYTGKVKTSSVGEHILFLKEIGEELKEMSRSNYKHSTMELMEKLFDKISMDLDNRRKNNKETIDGNLVELIKDMSDFAAAIVIGVKEKTNTSPEWSKNLRKFIELFGNLSCLVFLFMATETIMLPTLTDKVPDAVAKYQDTLS